MTTVTIDLKKNPEIADLVSDKSVGDGVTLHTSIKAKDDQTLTLTVEEAEDGGSYDSEDDGMEDEESDSEDDEEPAGNGTDQINPEAAVPPGPPRDRNNY